jgi:uncharacterized protein (TIGR00661 family)
MKVFYGVQATGNGHITRARVMAKEFKKIGADVTYFFSGRDRSKMFDMDIFGDYICVPGLTFAIKDGSINIIDTFVLNNISTFINDIRTLDLSDYDVVITDFEPITAWAGKLQNKKVLGIGHQYAFDYNIPIIKGNFISKQIMKLFAPVTVGLGLHWHHFNQPILPPIIETEPNGDVQHSKILVYLPFENSEVVINTLSLFDDYDFFVYGSDVNTPCPNHIQIFNPSREQFHHDLATCAGVICNSGFELVSEALQLGKHILVKPVQGQMEQASNALALTRLGYGWAMPEVDGRIIDAWLSLSNTTQVKYPNVARYVVEWLNTKNDFVFADVWDQVKY